MKEQVEVTPPAIQKAQAPQMGAPMQPPPPPTPNPDAVDIPALKTKLVSLINGIRDLRIKHGELSIEKGKTVLMMRDLESNAMKVAVEASDDKGKKINTNAESRKAHAESILEKSEAYKAHSSKIESLDEQLRLIGIEAEYNTNLLRGMEIISRYRS